MLSPLLDTVGFFTDGKPPPFPVVKEPRLLLLWRRYDCTTHGVGRSGYKRRTSAVPFPNIIVNVTEDAADFSLRKKWSQCGYKHFLVRPLPCSSSSADLLTPRNPRLGTNGGLEDERQLLVEEQKLCRSRARKFSLETNRRRRALEQRQKQRDVQEQQLTENILLQRRQRVQDATERFQRAHLPPSQRRSRNPFPSLDAFLHAVLAFRRNVPNIEDALNQIQGSSPFSFLSGNSNISR
uniref:Uncharacterized protein n=1 Tax=Gasterosteus aculeatus aculeatus TaxID=481459 RepID=G3PEP9_GASAC